MQFTSLTAPTLPLLSLSDSEKRLIVRLQSEGQRDLAEMQAAEMYYQGHQPLRNLRISVPENLEFLRTIVGWPAVAVDPYVERLGVDCFRLSGGTDADDHMMELWDLNNGPAEQSLAFTDALSMKRSYWCIGSPVESGGVPRITVESPLNTSVLWDRRGRATAALLEYWDGDQWKGAVMVPGQTIHLARDENATWVVERRDMHGFDFVPIVRMANRPRTNYRNGFSEISPALMSITDSACRTLLALEVAREIYSVPQKVLLGETESSFRKPDGTAASVWDATLTKFLGIERDDNGDLPEIHQMQVYDPSVFTKLIDMYASQASGILAATPQDLGLFTEGNPVSAEAAQVSEYRRDRRAILKQSMFGGPLRTVMQYALRFENGGQLPTEFERLSVDWRDVKLDSPAVTADAITKQVAAMVIPARSDVTLKRLGYNAVERERLAQDAQVEDGRMVARTLAENVQAVRSQNAAGALGGGAGLR